MVTRARIITDLSDAARERAVHSGRRSVCDGRTSKAAGMKQKATDVASLESVQGTSLHSYG